MKTIALIRASVLSTSLLIAGQAMAEGNPLSVHVLNLETGLPSSGVAVTLEKAQGEQQWKLLSSGVTNEVGRISALFPAGASLEPGTYKVTFKTGKWFAEHQGKTFFPEVPVIFSVDGSVKHYHIPLLLSPYGFSTYRGN
ncbi:hydroxyisourate hydrolase [Bordetella avium]|uniref:hydroxyisourate hydrolase n=1 Tax=Bordetella avium TaxID=521 RepID=UPI000E68602E|nr:hydroxyisourate hydrolase [Bordetella avium]RIQ19115.1 hydroxyisourate hydrolase [Bordetella avium]RIQ32026.1 hydroxyisourate hydrolase [Bordetella avium]